MAALATVSCGLGGDVVDQAEDLVGFEVGEMRGQGPGCGEASLDVVEEIGVLRGEPGEVLVEDDVDQWPGLVGERPAQGRQAGGSDDEVGRVAAVGEHGGAQRDVRV